LESLKIKNNFFKCSAINYFVGLTNHSNTCQLFSSEYVQHTDGYMEADDRYFNFIFRI